MKERKLRIMKLQRNNKLRHTESESDCFGDSEQSDSEDDSENVRIVSPVTMSRKEFAKTRQTLAEEQLENNKGELVCLTCLKRFSNVQNLRRHLRLHLSRDSNIPDFESDSENCDNSNNKFICDFCPERFSNKSGFLVHEKTHIAEALACYVCGKTYSDRYSLRYHLRIHGIGEQIRCELCGKNFTKRSRLQSHIDLFHNDLRKFECAHCDKTFKTKIHLENHLLKHTGEKPYKCETCGDMFRHKLSLVTHMRVHEDSRPFICDTCGKGFRDSSTLKAHKRVHSGDKPYKCNLCEKSFTQRAGLNYHKTVHSGSKPHKCNFCDFATAKKSSLRSHTERMHKNSSSASKVSVEIECLEKTSPSTPPLPSPPTQQGDAVFTPSQESTISLPSFNILKSYDSPSLVPVSPCCSESGGSSQDSLDDLPPPLSPPGQDYQHHSENYQSLSSQPAFNRLNSCSVSTIRNGNQPITQGWSKDYSHQEHAHHTLHLQEQEHHVHPPYCQGNPRKSFFDYQHYYGLQSYGALPYYPQREEGYSLPREQRDHEEEEEERKKMAGQFYDKVVNVAL